MKKTAIAAALLVVTGSANANVWTMTDGTFEFYDASGALADTHNDVQGTFDLDAGTGSFSTSTPFNGILWSTDVDNMVFAPNDGTTVDAAFTWQTQTWFIGGSAVTCRIGASIDNCADEATSGGTFLGTSTSSYTFTLSDGQFAAGVFFDWSVNEDIPVLAVMQVTAQGVDINGNPTMTVVSVDGDNDGVPGTAMLTPPFPGQTPAFSGVLVCPDCTPAAVPVPAAVWLFGSGLIGLAGVARRRKAA